MTEHEKLLESIRRYNPGFEADMDEQDAIAEEHNKKYYVRGKFGTSNQK